jgi:hypothetical protein
MVTKVKIQNERDKSVSAVDRDVENVGVTGTIMQLVLEGSARSAFTVSTVAAHFRVVCCLFYVS